MSSDERVARDTWLILHELNDASVPWLAEGLGRRLAGGRLLCLSSLALQRAPQWRVTLDAQGRTRWALGLGGQRLVDEQVAGVINRMASTAPPAQRPDSAYIDQEWRALLAAWLNGIFRSGVPVLNRASPPGLAGPVASPGWWRLRAAAAGLPVMPWPDAPGAVAGFTAVVIGGQCLPLLNGLMTPTELQAWEPGLIRLAQSVGAGLLGIACARDGQGRALFCLASSTPDLRQGGPALLDALALQQRMGMPSHA
jgi:hypothetical protein